MNEFTASNGIRLFTDDQLRIDMGPAPVDVILTLETSQALREFFRAEEDERLGRWRWPENDQYVVYEVPDYQLLVVDESGRTAHIGRTWMQHHRDAARTSPHAEAWAYAAAVAYLDAHPEPKPAWDAAKLGEVWVLTNYGSEDVYVVVRHEGSGLLVFRPVSLVIPPGMPMKVTAGRRIWPEVTE